jgi:hypothetical protein
MATPCANFASEIVVVGTGCIIANISGDGSCNTPYVIEVSEAISADAGNSLECRPDGLYAAPTGEGGTGGPETTTTMTVNVDGVVTYTNEVGAVTSFRSADKEKIVFASRDLITVPSTSGLDIDTQGREIYAIAVTVDSAPTGNETFRVVDRGPTGVGSTIIYSGTLLSGTLTTGIINITPYELPAGNLLQSNILTANGSQKWSLHIFYTSIISEIESTIAVSEPLQLENNSTLETEDSNPIETE